MTRESIQTAVYASAFVATVERIAGTGEPADDAYAHRVAVEMAERAVRAMDSAEVNNGDQVRED